MEAMVNVKGTIKFGSIIDRKVYVAGDNLDICITKTRLQEVRKDFLEGVVEDLRIIPVEQRPKPPTSEEPEGTNETEEVNEKPEPKTPVAKAKQKK